MWATFVSKFIDKNFQKLPNLVTLQECIKMYFDPSGQLHLKGKNNNQLQFGCFSQRRRRRRGQTERQGNECASH